MIEISKLEKSYSQGGRNLNILRGIDLKMNEGESVAIVGESGSGKSTLLSLLSGLDSPDSGSILIQEQDISKLNEGELASFRGKRIGIVFQQFHIFQHLSALENVMLPLEILGSPQPDQPSLELLKRIGLEQRQDHFPTQLSGGEMQRVAIARAIVHEPALLLADEPSGNLDTRTGEEVMEIFFELIRERKMTMVLVTHNIELAGKCERVFRLQDGILKGMN